MTHFKASHMLLITFLIFTLGVSIIYFSLDTFSPPEVDSIAAKRIAKEASLYFDNLSESDFSFSSYDFTILDAADGLVYQTRPGLSTSLSEAIKQHYTLVPITENDQFIGTALIDTSFTASFAILKKKLIVVTSLLLATLLISYITYTYFLNIYILKPFKKLQFFAQQVASGNLDMPLTMDKHNIFGAFTESFDLMRHELALAREKEFLANQSKKELVASLSHDIKTPITSIKLTTELLTVLIDDEKVQTKLSTIYEKSEQIDALVTDLFHTTLEDLGELKVSPKEVYSSYLESLIHEADYLGKVSLSAIPDCILLVDPLRLSQVIGNIVSNSYKYADTPIHITSQLSSSYLEVSIKDFGPGVSSDDLPLLFNKFYRGQNTDTQNGSGLGLYISKQLLNAMEGDILATNASDGFSLLILLKLA